MVEIYEKQPFQNTYRTLLEDTLCVGRDVAPREKVTKELNDVIFTLDGTEPLTLIGGRTNFNYLIRELAWYLSRDPNVDYIAQHAKMWRTAANPDGTANSNYGDAVLTPHITGYGPPTSEFEWVVTSILNDPDTRQACMVFHRPDHHWVNNKDVPCTLNMRFRVRDGKLEAWAHMRSCDLWWGLPYDVNWFKLMHRAVYGEVMWNLQSSGVQTDTLMGDLNIQLDSAHLYERHYPRARKLISEPVPISQIDPPLRLNAAWLVFDSMAHDLDKHAA